MSIGTNLLVFLQNIYSKGVQTDEIEVDAVPIIDGFNSYFCFFISN